MTKNQFCAVLAFGFLLGVITMAFCWSYQVDQLAARLLHPRAPVSVGEPLKTHRGHDHD